MYYFNRYKKDNEEITHIINRGLDMEISTGLESTEYEISATDVAGKFGYKHKMEVNIAETTSGVKEYSVCWEVIKDNESIISIDTGIVITNMWEFNDRIINEYVTDDIYVHHKEIAKQANAIMRNLMACY